MSGARTVASRACQQHTTQMTTQSMFCSGKVTTMLWSWNRTRLSFKSEIERTLRASGSVRPDCCQRDPHTVEEVCSLVQEGTDDSQRHKNTTKSQRQSKRKATARKRYCQIATILSSLQDSYEKSYQCGLGHQPPPNDAALLRNVQDVRWLCVRLRHHEL